MSYSQGTVGWGRGRGRGRGRACQELERGFEPSRNAAVTLQLQHRPTRRISNTAPGRSRRRREKHKEVVKEERGEEEGRPKRGIWNEEAHLCLADERLQFLRAFTDCLWGLVPIHPAAVQPAALQLVVAGSCRESYADNPCLAMCVNMALCLGALHMGQRKAAHEFFSSAREHMNYLFDQSEYTVATCLAHMMVYQWTIGDYAKASYYSTMCMNICQQLRLFNCTSNHACLIFNSNNPMLSIEQRKRHALELWRVQTEQPYVLGFGVSPTSLPLPVSMEHLLYFVRLGWVSTYVPILLEQLRSSSPSPFPSSFSSSPSSFAAAASPSPACSSSSFSSSPPAPPSALASSTCASSPQQQKAIIASNSCHQHEQYKAGLAAFLVSLSQMLAEAEHGSSSAPPLPGYYLFHCTLTIIALQANCHLYLGQPVEALQRASLFLQRLQQHASFCQRIPLPFLSRFRCILQIFLQTRNYQSLQQLLGMMETLSVATICPSFRHLIDSFRQQLKCSTTIASSRTRKQHRKAQHKAGGKEEEEEEERVEGEESCADEEKGEQEQQTLQSPIAGKRQPGPRKKERESLRMQHWFEWKPDTSFTRAASFNLLVPKEESKRKGNDT